MKRVNRKKCTTYILLLYAALYLNACEANIPAANETEAERTNTREKTVIASTENVSPRSNAVIDTDIGTETEITDGNEEITVSSVETSVHITMETEEKKLTTEDGKTYLTLKCTYPVVSIEGNDTAAESINADIQSNIDLYYMEKDYYEDLKADAAHWHGGTNYNRTLFYSVKRADDKVISFTVYEGEYTFGLHPQSFEIGVNYDTETGNPITFESLSEDPDAFRAATLAYNKELAATDSYERRMFTQDYITNGTLESVLYEGDVWYLSTYGLSFMSNPYMLGSYVAGTIEFIIPYNALADMGLKDVYTYADRLIMKIPDIGSEEDSIDLNNDGIEDAVVSYYKFVIADIEKNTYTYQPHFTVNGTDYALDGTDDVTEKLTDIDSIYLYDLDVNDGYVELVTSCWEYSSDGYHEYSNFFRYTKDCSLVYLGRIKGDITDPTVSYFELENGVE